MTYENSKWIEAWKVLKGRGFRPRRMHRKLRPRL